MDPTYSTINKWNKKEKRLRTAAWLLSALWNTNSTKPERRYCTSPTSATGATRFLRRYFKDSEYFCFSGLILSTYRPNSSHATRFKIVKVLVIIPGRSAICLHLDIIDLQYNIQNSVLYFHANCTSIRMDCIAHLFWQQIIVKWESVQSHKADTSYHIISYHIM
jgi:hypothetical protein